MGNLYRTRSGETTSTTEFSDFGLGDKYNNIFCELSQQEDSRPTNTAEFPHFSSIVGATSKPTLQNQSSSCHQPSHQSSSSHQPVLQSSSSNQPALQSSSSQLALQPSSSDSGRYGKPITDQEILEACMKAIPKKTQQGTEYCVRMWNSWRNNRIKQDFDIPQLTESDKNIQAHWLARFIIEVRKINGCEYPPNTLYHIVNGIMRHVCMSNPGTDFYNDAKFSGFISSLNAEMKRLKSKGIGSTQKQAEPLSPQTEELLLERKILGNHTLQALLNTIIFMNGLYFAFRSEDEHYSLRRSPCQIKIVNVQGREVIWNILRIYPRTILVF